MGMREHLAKGNTVSAKKTKSVLMEVLEDRQLLSTYYVSSSGNDGKSGTSTGSAWRTISRVNKQTLKSGDKVLFQGGKSFSGALVVNSNEGGVTFSTYGSGRATINSGGSSGLKVSNTTASVYNLIFNGSKGGTSGIYFGITSSGKHLSNVTIDNVEVKNYGHDGIEFDINGRGGSYVNNVKIEDTSVHHNGYSGIEATSMQHNINKNWLVQRVKAYENIGSTTSKKVTGSGIYIA